MLNYRFWYSADKVTHSCPVSHKMSFASLSFTSGMLYHNVICHWKWGPDSRSLKQLSSSTLIMNVMSYHISTYTFSTPSDIFLQKDLAFFIYPDIKKEELLLTSETRLLYLSPTLAIIAVFAKSGVGIVHLDVLSLGPQTNTTSASLWLVRSLKARSFSKD